MFPIDGMSGNESSKLSVLESWSFLGHDWSEHCEDHQGDNEGSEEFHLRLLTVRLLVNSGFTVAAPLY